MLGLADRRRSEGLTRGEIAVACGVPRGVVTHWEIGRQSVQVRHQTVLVDLLGLPDGYFPAPRQDLIWWVPGTLLGYRVGKGLSMVEVARHVGVGKSLIDQWEKAGRTPRRIRHRRVLTELLDLPDGFFDLEMTFAEYRRDKGLTQGQLGVRVGVVASTVSRWETGMYPVPARHRGPLVELLGLPDGFFGADDVSK